MERATIAEMFGVSRGTAINMEQELKTEVRRGCSMAVILRRQCERIHSAPREQVMQSRNDAVRSEVCEGHDCS